MPSDPNLLPLPDAADALRSGEAAFESIKGAIQEAIDAAAGSAAAGSATLPATDAGQIPLSLLGLISALEPHRDAALARFSAEERARALAPFFASARTWALATVFVAACYAKTPSPENTLQRLWTEGKSLRKRAFKIVRLLEGVGLVSPGTTAKLTAGTGYRDFASDCTLSARHIRAHWDSLSPLLAKQTADPFTADHLQDLTALGDAITLELAKLDGTAPVAWRAELLACLSHLSALYEPWREAMRYHLTALGRPEASWLSAFLTLGRIK